MIGGNNETLFTNFAMQKLVALASVLWQYKIIMIDIFCKVGKLAYQFRASVVFTSSKVAKFCKLNHTIQTKEL